MNMVLIPPREIIPMRHQVFLEEGNKPYYINCTLKTCRICWLGECAKNEKFIDDLIKELFGK